MNSPSSRAAKGKRRSTSAACAPPPGTSPWTWVTRTPVPPPVPSPSWTGSRASCATGATPLSSWPRKGASLEVAYLLLNGELPNAKQLDTFEGNIRYHSLVHEDMKHFFQFFPSNAHPMGILSAMINSLSTFYPKSQDRPTGPARMWSAPCSASSPRCPPWRPSATRTTWATRTCTRTTSLGYVENFLHMMFGLPTEEYVVDPVVVDALNKLLILHADHEQNCSASTVRMVGSSPANLYSAVSAGIAALWGPLHGGANQEVIEMLETIRNDGGDIQKWVNKAKDKQRPLPSVRLRPPGVQELRPPRHHHQEELRRPACQVGCEGPRAGHRQASWRRSP
jgi:citrate synthase